MVATDDDEDTETTTAAGDSGPAVPTGRVVGVAQRNWRSYVATLQTDLAGAGGRTASEKVLAVPVDRRIPKVRMSSRQVAQLANSRIIIRIDDWPLDSK
jgi:exoribonuclease R